MTTSAQPSGFQPSQLTAINLAKVITLGCLVALALVYGVQTPRQILYLCLHISYCLWWLLEQVLFPERKRSIFTDPIGWVAFGMVQLYVGVFYALPGYLAFTNPVPISVGAIALALPLYIFGSLINTAADVQKMTAKGLGQGLVQDGIWRSVRNVNYLGDLMRYTSFSVLAGSPWAYLLPGSVALVYIQKIFQKERTMAAKYPDFAAYQQRSRRLIPWIW